MMSSSFVFLLLSSLLLPQSPSRPPTAPTKLFRYVPHNATFVAGVDLGAFGGQTLKAFQSLGKESFIANIPQAARGFRQAEKSLHFQLALLKMWLGVKLFEDIEYVTISMVSRKRASQYLVAFAGHFPTTMEKKLVKALRVRKSIVKAGGFRIYKPIRKQHSAMAWSDKGIFLLGSPALLQRTAGQSKKRCFASKTLAATMLRYHQTDSMISLGLRLPPFARRKLMRRSPFFFWLVDPHVQDIHLALQYKGMSVTMESSREQTLARLRLLLDGVGTFLLAGEHTLRGTIKVADGLLEPTDRRMPSKLTQLARNKEQLLAFLLKKIGRHPTPHRIELKKGKWVRLTARGKGASGLLLGGLLTGYSKSAPAAPRKPRRSARFRPQSLQRGLWP